MPPAATRTRNGKIARLPKAIREQLNRRLDDNEQGKLLVEWINSLPEAQAVFKSEFNGCPLNEQNLSAWKQGGFRAWQKQQERLELVQQWTEDAKELADAAGTAKFSSGLSMILLTELAQALRDALEECPDKATRLERLNQVTQRFAQLRREETNTARVQMARERWEHELAEEAAEKNRGVDGPYIPLHAFELQTEYLSWFSQASKHRADNQPDRY